MVLTVVYLMSIVNYVTCSFLCFLVNLNKGGVLSGFLSKRCVVYQRY